MRERIVRKISDNPELAAFLLAVFALGITNGVFQTTYNNYLDDVFQISATQRGMMEFPRELPGFLVALLTGALFFLVENRVGAIAALLTGIGMFGLGLVEQSWAGLLIFTVVWSMGQHIDMPMRSAIAMSLGTDRQHGRRLGQAAGTRVGANVVGALFVWLVIDYVGQNYLLTFFFGGVAAMVAALLYLRIRLQPTYHQREKLVIRKEYSVYYALSTIYGARKQIFVTFAPWLLVTIYGEPASTIAKLWIASSVIGVFFHHGLGTLIDTWGERNVLIADGFVVALICLGYAFAENIGLPGAWPVRLIYVLYVCDHMLLGIENARSAYLAKIAQRPEHVSASLSMGITLNHLVAMLVPFFGGAYIWDVFGHQWVFVAGAAVSLVTMMIATLARTPRYGEGAPERREDDGVKRLARRDGETGRDELHGDD